jgi:hypothetical protein
MPTLTVVVSDDATNTPVVWQCTECSAVFDFGRITIKPSREQMVAMNQEFARHCAQAHPNSRPVVGLPVPEQT